MMIPSNSALSAVSTADSKIAIVITAAGSSSRMGGSVKKEYLPLGKGTLLSSSARAFVEASKNPGHPFNISHMIITVPAKGQAAAAKALSDFFEAASYMKEKLEFVEGGQSRQKSILNALEHLKKSKDRPDFVLIHDGARPFISTDLIYSVLQATKEFKAAAPGLVPTDTIKVIDKSGFLVQHLERASLTAIQTPQGFSFEELYEAHKKAALDGHDYTDDTEIWGKYLGKVKLVPGQPENKKITYPGDMPGEAAL